MFASQLLRILQTIPNDVKNETCVSSEKDTSKKENMNSTLYDSNFGGKEFCPSIGVQWDTNPLSAEDRNGPQNLAGNEFQNGPFYPPSRSNKDPESSSSDSKENLMTAGHSSIFNENEVKDSGLTEAEAFTDKNVLACENQIDFHVVKDICMDEGSPLNSKKSTKISENELPARFIPLESTEEENNEKGNLAPNELPNLPLGAFLKGVGVNELGGAKSSSENYSDNDLMPRVEMSCGKTEETVTDCSADRSSFVERAIPIQEFGTRSFLRSFISSLDGEDNKIGQFRPNQEDVQTTALFYYSKVKSKSITFDFDPPLIETAGVSIGKPKNAIIQPFDSTSMHGRKNSGSYGPSDSSTEKEYHEKSLKVENVFADDFSFENAFQGVGSHVSKVNGNELVVDQEKNEHDESGFSDAGFGPRSGPIPFSGSISFRSDGSATSRRSFAFPILQSEWNSSPIRMTKDDERHLRKHKFWRSSLLCCRF